jgi:hypothetical protein
MIHIETKRVRKVWYCFGTIQGYDHSFNGLSMGSAQRQMNEMLERKQIKAEECIWEEPKEFDTQPQRPQPVIGIIIARLDYL